MAKPLKREQTCGVAPEKVNQTCEAVARYYRSLDADYDALFSNYCDDNGFDADDVKEELNVDAQESQLLDFDDDFPFHKDMIYKDEATKMQFIFDLISKCWRSPQIKFDIKMPLYNRDLFTFNEKQLDQVKKLYKKQCPVLWNNGMESDQVFLRILAIGRIHGFDYLSHLVDDYFRDRVKNIHKSWDANEWAQHHKHFKTLKKIQFPQEQKQQNTKTARAPSELAQAAVKSFGARCCPKLLFSNIILIDDSLEIYVKYIATAIEWICNLINNPSNSGVCPFQMDLCVAVGKPKTAENIVDTQPVDEKNDDSDDDDDDPNDQKGDPNHSALKYFDCIGDIEHKLKKNKLKYALGHHDADFEQPQTRMYGNIFKKLRETLDKKSYQHKKDAYPLEARFVSFIDRRGAKTKKPPNDSIWMYTPPDNCRAIPKGAVSEWYVSSSRTSLLPNKEYGDGKEAENAKLDESDSNKTEEKILNANIGSSSHCKGSLVTMSFIMKESDAIKSYFYWNGQIMRFMPSDIKTVFPRLWNMKWNDGNKIEKGAKSLNEQFMAKTQEIEGLIERMNERLYDKYYDGFVQSYL